MTPTEPTGLLLKEGRPYLPSHMTRDQVLDALVMLTETAAPILGESHEVVAYARLQVAKARRQGRAAAHTNQPKESHS